MIAMLPPYQASSTPAERMMNAQMPHVHEQPPQHTPTDAIMLRLAIKIPGHNA
jgi:hypothetical protein